MTVLFDNRFAEITHDGDLLTLTWHPDTSEMSEQDFQDTMLQFAELAMAQGAHHLLVDVRGFAFQPSGEMGLFREREIIPRYNTAGVTRFAFLFAPGHVPGPAIADPGAKYETANFDGVAEARAWLEDG